MNKLFEEISSVERREIVRYYKNKKMKRSIKFENFSNFNNDYKNFTKVRKCTYSNYLKKWN